MKQLPLLWSNGERTKGIRALLCRKRQNHSSSKSCLHGAIAALEGKPFNTKSLSPLLWLFNINITEPKEGELKPCTTSQVCISSELSHWARRKGIHLVVKNGWLSFVSWQAEVAAWRGFAEPDLMELQLRGAAPAWCSLLLPLVLALPCVATQAAKPGICLVVNEGGKQTKKKQWQFLSVSLHNTSAMPAAFLHVRNSQCSCALTVLGVAGDDSSPQLT